MDDKVIAIDLGTTFSEVAVIGQDGRPRLLMDETGDRMVESAIWFKDGGEEVFGEQARRMKPLTPDKVLFQVKPDWDHSGTDYSVGSETVGPVEVASKFYEYLKLQAEASLGTGIEKAVITSPAYFHDMGTEVMTKGAERARLEVMRVLKEPSAAAIGYALGEALSVGEKVLVFDLGGGTFDVSLIEVSGQSDGVPEIDILRNNGDTEFGGRDFDRMLVEELFVPRFKQEHGFDPTEEPKVEAKWLEEAEKLKKDLSSAADGTTYLQGGGESSALSVTREEFKELIEPKIDHSLEVLKENLKGARTDPSEVDRLVFVGGSTRIPAFREEVSNFLSLEPETGVDPDRAVVVGAALIAGAKGNEVIRDSSGRRIPLLESKISDVTSRGLGIKALDESDGYRPFNQILIPPGEPLPATGQRTFKPKEDDAKVVKFTLLEGDSEDIDQARVLAEDYELKIYNPRSAGSVRVTIELVVDENGLIKIRGETRDGDWVEEEFDHPNIAD